MMLALTAAAAWAWWRELKRDIPGWSQTWWDHRGAIGLIGLCWVLLIVHECAYETVQVIELDEYGRPLLNVVDDDEEGA